MEVKPMELINSLKEKYKPNTPIFIKDLKNKGISDVNIRKIFSRCKEIKRYDKGIYYFPEKTIFGDSTLSFNDIIEAKYICKENDIFGYYTGLTFLNYFGLSTQVPNVLEVTTNNESTKKREVTIKGRKIILRRGRVTINIENYLILQFLDLFNILELYQIKENYDIFKNYILNNKFCKEDITYLLPKYSRKVLNNLIESGLIYEFTSR